VNALQTIKSAIRNLNKFGDITEQESDEIFLAAHDSLRYNLTTDKNLIAALKLWYNEVHSRLKDGKDGNFVSTLPLVRIKPEVKAIISDCLNLLPWHKKVLYAGLPAKLLQISKLPKRPKSKLPCSFDIAEGIRIYRTNRHANIITAMSDRVGLFQKVNIKVDLNKYSSIDAESSAAINWWKYYFSKKSGQVSSKIFLSSCNDLWLHAIMKIAERFKVKPPFIMTYNGKAKIYVDNKSYEKIKPYLSFNISNNLSPDFYDKSIIDKTIDEIEMLKFESELKSDLIKISEDEWDEWSKIIR